MPGSLQVKTKEETVPFTDGTYYQFTTAEIGPRHLGRSINVIAETNAGENTKATVTVCPMSYVYEVVSNNELFTTAQQNAMAAYYDYYLAAAAY